MRRAWARLWVTITTVICGAQPLDQRLDGLGGDRVQRGGRLVEQQHVRADGQRPGQAEQLLLAAGQPERGILQAVADRAPEPDLGEPLLRDLPQAGLLAIRWAWLRR